jgi:hypothetical protein
LTVFDKFEDTIMKSSPYIVFIFIIILYSCSARKRQEPAILEGKKIDVSSIYKKKGADLVEALYEELVNNSDSLKKLEREIKDLKAAWPDSLESFKTYHEKSVQYYETAEKKATAITDSVLRQSLLDFIRKSRQHYRDSIAPLRNIDSLIKQRAAAIDNLHQTLKLMATLPVIEEFQLSHRPDTFNTVDLTRRLDELVAKLDSMTKQLRPQPVVVPSEKK